MSWTSCATYSDFFSDSQDRRDGLNGLNGWARFAGIAVDWRGRFGECGDLMGAVISMGVMDWIRAGVIADQREVWWAWIWKA